MNKAEINYGDVVIINGTEYRVFSVNEHEINLHNVKGELATIEIKAV